MGALSCFPLCFRLEPVLSFPYAGRKMNRLQLDCKPYAQIYEAGTTTFLLDSTPLA